MFAKLLHQAQCGDKESLQTLVLEFDRLIHKIAERASVDKEDCFQVLSIAFIRAIPKFNLEVSLNTYIGIKQEKGES